MNYHFTLLDKLFFDVYLLLYSSGLPMPLVPGPAQREKKGRRTEVQETSPQEGQTTRKRVGGDGEPLRPSLTVKMPRPSLAQMVSRKLGCWLSSSRRKGCGGSSPNLDLFLESCLMLMPSSGPEALSRSSCSRETPCQNPAARAWWAPCWNSAAKAWCAPSACSPAVPRQQWRLERSGLVPE